MAYKVCVLLNIFQFWGGFAHEREEQLFLDLHFSQFLNSSNLDSLWTTYIQEQNKPQVSLRRKVTHKVLPLCHLQPRMHQCWELFRDEEKHKKIKISDCVPRLTFTEKMFLPGKKIKPSSFLNSTYTVLNKNQRLYQRKQTLWKMRFR